MREHAGSVGGLVHYLARAALWKSVGRFVWGLPAAGVIVVFVLAAFLYVAVGRRRATRSRRAGMRAG